MVHAHPFGDAVMIELQNHLLNPLHIAAISPVSESSLLHAKSTHSFKVVLSGGNELTFAFESENDARDALVRLRQLVDQASTRR